MDTLTPPQIDPFYRLTEKGEHEFHPHPGQVKVLYSPARFILALGGRQSGKTVIGPLWLRDEVERCGAGDYLCVAPSYPLMQKKMLPEFNRLFQTQLRLGTYRSGDRVFKYHDSETQIFFGHADDPDSLESATAKAAWLDEAGQSRFRLGSWEAIQGRLTVNTGRALITTTPYNCSGWLKQQVYDRWEKGDRNYDVVNFVSTMNPAFPPAEFERLRNELPPWRFRMFYMGRFERPAGLIYDSFDPVAHVCPRFKLPDQWPRYLGLDFGGVNTAGLFYAMDPKSERLYLYREYKAGGRTAKAHAEKLLAGEPMVPTCVGGSKSEGQWRDEFRAGGLPVMEPAVSDVEVGINRVYGAHARGEIIVFDDLEGYLEEKATYSRETDDAGEPTEKIAEKNEFHYCDAERYIVGWLKRGGKGSPGFGHPANRDRMAGGVRRVGGQF